MIALFDASAFATFVLLDPGWTPLAGWLRAQAPSPVLSDFGWGEFVSAVSLRVRLDRITEAQADDLILSALAKTATWKRIEVVPSDIAGATELVRRYDLMLKLPDAIHIAMAVALSAVLVTADRRQANAARALGLPVLNPLSEVPAP